MVPTLFVQVPYEGIFIGDRFIDVHGPFFGARGFDVVKVSATEELVARWVANWGVNVKVFRGGTLVGHFDFGFGHGTHAPVQLRKGSP